MEIEKIIYETTRSIYSVEDKLSIATVFVFCYKLNNKKFAELLYTEDHESFVKSLNDDYLEYEVDFSIRFNDKNIKECFYKTLEKVIEKNDSNGYFNALFNKDEYALVIDEIVNYKFDKIEFKKFTKNLVEQLSFDF